LILVRGDKSDCETTSSETASSPHTMKIAIWSIRHIVIYDDVDSFDVDSSTENVCGDTDSLVEVFETLVASDTTKSTSLFDGKAGRGGTVLLVGDRRGW